MNFSPSVGVGNGSAGTLTLNGGSSISTKSIFVGNNGNGNGTVTVTGTGVGGSPQTTLNLTGPADGTDVQNPLTVGNWGIGTMTVSNGAVINGAIGNAFCLSNLCNNFIGNAAGSTGTLTLTGAGTTASLGGGFFVGSAAVFTTAHGDGFDFGTPGGHTNGTVQVLNGATLNTYNSGVSTGGGGGAPTGTETTSGHVVVDGAGSSWQITRNPVTGLQAQLGIASKVGATGIVDVTNGGQLVVTGSGTYSVPGSAVPGITLSGGSGGGTSTLNVSGPGSAVIVNGDTGFINVGRVAGTADMNITNGAQVFGGGTNGLVNMNVGRGTSTATLTVDGAGSQLTLSGVCGLNSGCDTNGAFLGVGRETGTGTVSVTNGGAILIRDNGQNAIGGGTGFQLGRDAGSSGTLTVSGATSTLTIVQTGAGSTASPGFLVGRDGNGQMFVINGGTVLVHDNGQSAAGGGAGLTVARNDGSSGSLTVSGVGSSITINQTGLGTNNPGITVGRAGTGQMLVTDGATVAVNGSIQRSFIVGNTVNDGAGPVGGTGILTVSNGASISASWFAVGNNSIGGSIGGTGTATIDNASVNIDGVTIAPDNSITGGGLRVGRGTGSVGTLTLQNGAQITINTPTTTPEIYLGGTGVATGGSGTVIMTGGSSISFTGTGATPNVVIGHSGTGLWTMDGASTLSVPVDGTIRIGATSTGIGQLEIRGGSTIDTGILIVGGSGQGTVVMTSGALNILNNDINTNAFVLGNNAGSVGTFTQSGGDVQGGRALTVGNNGTGTYNLNTDLVNLTTPTLTTGFIALGNNSGQGTFNQQAGTTNTAGSLFIGPQGTYNLHGGSLDVSGQGTIVGTFGVGAQFNQFGGTHSVNTVTVGARSDASGTYVISGGNLAVSGQMFVGKGDDNLNPALLNGRVQQSGGTVTAAQIFIGGNSDGVTSFLGSGRYELSGGIVNSQFTPVGFLGQGQVVQTGGTFNAGELQLGSSGLFAIANGPGFAFYSSGRYDLQGGTLNTDSTTVSVFGQGTFNQSGTSAHIVTNNLTVGSQPALIEPNSGIARQGIYTLSGGTLNVGGNSIIGGGNDGFVGEPGAKGTFTQTGGTHTVTGNLIVGEGSAAGASSGGNGAYNISAGALVVGNSMIVGGSGAGPGLGGTGSFVQTGGATTIAGQLVLGADAGSTGTMSVSGGSSVTLTGAGATVVIGQGGTGVMTMIEASTLVLPTDGKVIVGASAGASGTLELQGGSSIQAGAVFGIGHNGTAPTGAASANVYLDQGSSVTATNIHLGDGCLGGNGGVLHGNFIMDGQAVVNCAPPVLPIVHPGMINPTGILHPGRSPGVLTFDGSFQFVAGTIVLEVESDGHGGFLTDEIIFTFGTVVDLTKANIQFAFLGNTDPNAFLPFWDLDTFLKTVSSGGTVEGISALGDLDSLFADASFTAESSAFVITDFTFDPAEGVTSIEATPVVTAVPEPASMMLVLLGCLLLAFARRRAVASPARRS